MNRAHGRQRTQPVREEIRILQATKSTQEGFEFQGIADSGKTHQFLMTSEALRELDGPVVIPPDLATVFEQHRQRIHGVAARVFSAGVRGEPIVMRIAYFRAARV